MIIVFILFFLIFSVNCIVFWLTEVSGHDKIQDQGYSGLFGYRNSDFYLCSERKYRVHYADFPPDVWSEEFTACQPAGKGIFIDAITISGGLEYGTFYGEAGEGKWGDPVTCYSIYNSSCYAGIINGEKSSCIYVYGDELYRVGVYYGVNTNEQNISTIVIKRFFDKELYFDYAKEIKANINEKNDQLSNITVQLFNSSNLHLIHFTGTIMIKVIKTFETRQIQDDNTKGLVTDYLKKILNEKVGLDLNFIEKASNSFYNNIVIDGMENGNIAINFYWLQKIIEIDLASRIAYDYHSYRSGTRIKIYLNDKDIELLLKVKNICKTMFKYTGIKISQSLKEKLSNFTSFTIVDDVIKQLGDFSTLTQKILFYTIWEKYTAATKKY